MSKPKKTLLLKIAQLSGAVCFLLQTTVLAQYRYDASFDSGSGFSIRQGPPAPFKGSALHRAVLQGDGRLLVAGDFDIYNGKSVPNLIRLLPDGLLDTSFNPIDRYGGDFWLQPGGRILAFAPNSAVRLNPDGSRDQSFVPPSFSNASVFSAILLRDHSIVVGGSFEFRYPESIGGARFSNILFLSRHGLQKSVDVGPGFNSGVYALATDDQDNIIVGGSFTRYDNQRCRPLVRIERDGFLDASFAPALNRSSGASAAVNAVVVQSDQKILVGGDFDSVGRVSTTSLIRLLHDGTLDPEFAVHVEGRVTRIFAAPDGKIWVAGDFTSVNGLACAGTARLNGDGSSDIIIEQQLFLEAAQPDGKLLVIEKPHERTRPLDQTLRRIIPEAVEGPVGITGLFHWSADEFLLCARTDPRKRHFLQRSEDLQTTWQDVREFSAGRTGFNTRVVAVAGEGRRFYRLRVEE